MDSCATILQSLSVKHLFATPLVISELPSDIVDGLNPLLKTLVLERAQSHASVHISNHGGWQSDDRIQEWGGEPVGILLNCIRQLLMQITLYVEGSTFNRGNIDWQINGWANVNRKNDLNIPHVHPGAYWSAVYYVAVDQSNDGPKGGELELFDPRGSLPKMYCPILSMGIQGYTTAGNSEIHRPKTGQCIVFPAWLAHSVKPYMGDETRISLAFNFSI